MDRMEEGLEMLALLEPDSERNELLWRRFACRREEDTVENDLSSSAVSIG